MRIRYAVTLDLVTGQILKFHFSKITKAVAFVATVMVGDTSGQIRVLTIEDRKEVE